MSSTGNSPLINALGMRGGESAGSQAQFSSLLQILTKILEALGGIGAGPLYTPYVWAQAGDLDITTVFPNATTGTFIIRQPTPAAINVTLPATGGPWIVADGAGVAATHNITVLASGGRTIKGTSSDVLNTNWESQTYLLDTTNYITLG